MKKSRVTIRDVARVARVTPQTVSRAIRNAPEVSAETREKVLKVAAELNYVKNNSASSLRCGNSKLIVIVYDHLVNIYFSIMIDYLQTCFRAQNYSILMLSVTKHQLDRSDYEFALSHNVAGIVSFLEPDKEVTEMLDNFAIPVLLFGRRTDIKSVDYICMDDEEAGWQRAALSKRVVPARYMLASAQPPARTIGLWGSKKNWKVRVQKRLVSWIPWIALKKIFPHCLKIPKRCPTRFSVSAIWLRST